MPDLEKLTINLTAVDLGQIELLVEQGFYSNRAEFIRVAIREQLSKHAETVRETTTRHAFLIGALTYNRRALEEARAEGRRMSIRLVGFLSIAEDVPPELAAEVIESVKVLGIFKASPAVKAALLDRTS